MFDHTDDSNGQNKNAMMLVEALNRTMNQSRSLLEKKDAIYALLKLFETKDTELLHMITEITKEQLETMNRHDTLIDHLIELGQLENPNYPELKIYADDIRKIKDRMHNSYALHAISKSRKSRNEVVSILSMAGDTVRSITDKLAGKSK